MDSVQSLQQSNPQSQMTLSKSDNADESGLEDSGIGMSLVEDSHMDGAS
jgi:hypothetical protein